LPLPARNEVSAWFGIFAPASLPQPVTQRLNAEFVKVMREPDLKPRLASLGADPLTSSPEHGPLFISPVAGDFAGRLTGPAENVVCP
jgi:tripartite-type tricarboxylate transporter receptor subunit TctC